MKALVIGKANYNYILPLQEFPKDGDKFYIDNSIKCVNDLGSVLCVTLASFGIDTSITTVVGDDDLGRKIKEFYNSYNIDTKYIETVYQNTTNSNYSIYNIKTNTFTNIVETKMDSSLTKYKYEFIPDVIIMDDGDYGANMAAINNYPNSNLIYIGQSYKNGREVYANKCKYVIATLDFASNITGILNNLNKSKTIINIFQKYMDMYSSNLIIKLSSFDFLYCVNDEVRLIKNVNNNLKNKDYVYYSVLVYFLINTNDIESSIKYTNKLMLSSKNELNMILNIPDRVEANKLLQELVSNNSNNNTVETLNTDIPSNEGNNVS